jgi:hypothetical protein
MEFNAEGKFVRRRGYFLDCLSENRRHSTAI